MRRIAALSLALLLILAASISSGQDKDKKKDDTPKKGTPKFTVGKETSYVDGPIDKNGHIDYVSALNDRLRDGVTPQNNANVLLWQAFGPHPEGAKVEAEFFTWLKIEPPPEKGDYFITLRQFTKDQLKLDTAEFAALEEELSEAGTRPWKTQDWPHLAAWLKVNEKPLALVTAATKRSHYHYPLVVAKTNGKSGSLIAALIPGVQTCRYLTAALTARAMLRTGEGKYDDAWQDLLATHRLGRLVSRGGTLIEGLVGLAVDSIAASADLPFLDAARLDANKAKSCLRDLQTLPSMALMADKINLTERFIFLDTVMQLDFHGVGLLDEMAGGKGGNPAMNIAFRDVQWDTALRKGNDLFSRLSVAMRLKERAMREKALHEIELEIKTRKANLNSPEEFIRTLLTTKNVGDTKGKYVGEFLITLMVPAVVKVQHAADRSEQTQQNLHVAFALAAYRSDQGRYPKTLDALAPKYLATVPIDHLTGKALIYRPNETGYLFYSVGINGEDEQGRSFDDDPRGDDLPVRMPLPKVREKK